jgi:hypothetical protein
MKQMAKFQKSSPKAKTCFHETIYLSCCHQLLQHQRFCWGRNPNPAFVTYLPKCVSSVFSWLPFFLAEQTETQSVAQPRAPL